MKRTCAVGLTGLALLAAVVGCERRAADPPVSVERRARPERSPLELRLTGSDFRWLIRYPGPDGQLDTADDLLARRHLNLPAGSRVTIDLRSDDYVYAFHLPDFDLIEAAIPDKPFRLEIDTGSPGTYELLGSQMCGFAHPELLGDLVVQLPDDFDAWLDDFPNP